MNDLYFYGILDFFPIKERLKETYKILSIDERYKYKMYVYSLPFEDDKTKDLIWEYLNDWKPTYKELKRKYKDKKKRNDKRRKKYENNYTDEIGQLERYDW